MSPSRLSLLLALGFASLAHAKILTVTTTNNVSPPAGQTNLVQALQALADGDTVQFNLPGTGPHYLLTPPGGYPYIRANGVTIDGYTQLGAVPNTNSILAANSAKIMIVLDSRNGNYTGMNYQNPSDPWGDSPGYGGSEKTILGLVDTSDVKIRGLAFLGVLSPGKTPPGTTSPSGDDISMYSVSLANSGLSFVQSNHISGCWFGVDPKDGTGVYPTYYGITGWGNGNICEDTIIGVPPGATDAQARAAFNVLCGQSIPIIIEGDRTRISGNFFGVLPDGLHDYNICLDTNKYPAAFRWEGHVELGDHSGAVIGTDGDGVNDALERNIFGGGLRSDVPLPSGGLAVGGYSRTIEFYGGQHNQVVVAGNYFGVGVDGTTRFTNATTVLDATAASGRYRFGSDFDGRSDALEGNVVFNNWPPSLITTNYLRSLLPNNLRGFSDLNLQGAVSYRGNKLVNCNPFPVSPTRDAGAWLTNYYTKALADLQLGYMPILSNATTRTQLVGRVPLGSQYYPYVFVDLYLPDPEGAATGKAVDAAAGTAHFPNGFVQGIAYLKSFEVDGPQDLDPDPGAFKFSLAGLDLQAAPGVTIVANYSVATNGTSNGETISSPFSAPVAFPATSLIVSATASNALADRPAVHYSGQTFTVSTGINFTTNYTVPKFGEDVHALTDRLHQWNGAATNLPLPAYLVGQEYAMTANNNRDVTNFSLTLQLSRDATVYLLVDNRVGDGSSATPPTIGPSAATNKMRWVDPAQGWYPVYTGHNRALSRLVPDEAAYDEVGGDGTGGGVGPGNALNQYASLYAKYIPAAGSVTVYEQAEGRNMFGLVVVPGKGPGLVPPVKVSMSVAGSTLQFSWTGGVGPYYVQRADTITSTTWTDVAGPVTGSAATAPAAAGYYRVRSVE